MTPSSSGSDGLSTDKSNFESSTGEATSCQHLISEDQQQNQTGEREKKVAIAASKKATANPGSFSCAESKIIVEQAENPSGPDSDHTSSEDDEEAPNIAFDAYSPHKNGQEAQSDDVKKEGSNPPSEATKRKRAEDSFTDSLRHLILSTFEEKVHGPVNAEAEKRKTPAKRITYTSEVRRVSGQSSRTNGRMIARYLPSKH